MTMTELTQPLLEVEEVEEKLPEITLPPKKVKRKRRRYRCKECEAYMKKAEHINFYGFCGVCRDKFDNDDLKDLVINDTTTDILKINFFKKRIQMCSNKKLYGRRKGYIRELNKIIN